ncbi:CDP-glycerol glycerophosphotransferase family protein [Bacillus arachidis]|uniref:CDP-glycerol glycerophosphotransferase family protein n=1 Tax=Bacillus arachidis TaxID=2819290 RepID=A0ABS3NST1_9BACI|nr:CDP-glycerol glycerophosphotransferase family protein [Bacillus arachidis]MBO1623997.1 CDP-glycerol glycerophosphotransferase family protein [Bacillus arachidis]
MKVKLLLEEINNVPKGNIRLDISVETDGEIEEVYKRIKGLFIQKGSFKKQLLSSSAELHADRMVYTLPISELSKIMNDGKLNLCLQLDQDILSIPIYNNIKEDFYICPKQTVFQLNTSDSIEKVVEFSRKDSVSIIVSVTEVSENKEKDLLILGDFSPEFKRKEVCLKELFLENNLTKEVRKLTGLKVNSHTNEYQAILELKDNPLYDGNWEMFCSGTFNDKPISIKVKYTKADKVVGSYFSNHDQLYYHVFSRNNKHEVVMSIEKNTEQMVSTQIDNVELNQNKLIIEGEVQFQSSIDTENQRAELLFIQRDTKRELSYPISVTDKYFESIVDFGEENVFGEKGIWDIFVSFEVQGIRDKVKLNLDSKSDFVIIPRTVYNQSSGVKRIRPYATLDNNLALLIRDEGVYCDVISVDYEASNLIVKGFVDIPDIDYVVKNVYLYEESLDLKMKCISEFVKEDEGYYFNSSYNWNAFDIGRYGELNLKFMIHIESDGHSIEFSLASNLDDIDNKARAIIYPPLNQNINGYPMQILPYYTNQNELSVTVQNSLQAYCIAMDSKNNNINLVICSMTEEQFEVQDTRLICRERNTGQTFIQNGKLNKLNEYQFDIDRSLIQTNEVQDAGKWDVYFAARINNNEVKTRVLCNDINIINQNSTFKSNAIKVGSELYGSIFFEKKNKTMSFETRNLKAHEKKKEKVRFLMAKGIAKIWGKFRKKPVWLIGENLGEVAQDNGFAFFESCVKKNVSEDYYYVSKAENKNMDNLEPYKAKVIRYDSFKHLCLYHLSNYLIVSHGIRDVIPNIVHPKMGSNTKPIIYLQHGIIAMKKLEFNSKSYNGMIKKFVVSSTHEKNILINKMNFKEKQIMTTGLARFDSLVDKSKDKKTREILLMPTWREWIIGSKEGFLESDFFVYYQGLLQDKRLHDLLEKNNLVLKFFPHIEIQKKYKDEFTNLNERIQFVKLGEESVKELIQNSSLMITDYSSVVFDFNYLKKPTIFYHFDVNDYLKHRGSYVDLNKDLVGDIAYTKEEVIKSISEYVKNDFKYKPQYLIKSKKYYAYHDEKNFERIYKEIKKISMKK